MYTSRHSAYHLNLQVYLLLFSTQFQLKNRKFHFKNRFYVKDVMYRNRGDANLNLNNFKANPV